MDGDGRDLMVSPSCRLIKRNLGWIGHDVGLCWWRKRADAWWKLYHIGMVAQGEKGISAGWDGQSGEPMAEAVLEMQGLSRQMVG